MLTPQSRCQLSHPRDVIGLRFHGRAPLVGPCLPLGHRAKPGLRQLFDVETGIIVVDAPYPLKVALVAPKSSHTTLVHWQHTEACHSSASRTSSV
jgi:hypothetical protein